MFKLKLRFSAGTAALVTILMSLILLALFAIPAVYAWHELIVKPDTERLSADLQRLTNAYTDHGEQALCDVIDVMGKSPTAGDESFFLLADSQLNPIAGNLPAWPAGVALAPGTYRVKFHLDGRELSALFMTHVLPDHRYLVAGRNRAHFELIETLFCCGLAGVASIIVLFGLLGRYLIRRTLLNEINEIGRTTVAILGGDLKRRLPIHHNGNELDLLALTVNRNLDQMEQLIHANRHVSDSIAHDLRTPLAELRFRLESLTLSHHPVDQLYDEIDAAIVDVDRVIQVFNALLRLAEIDHGARRAGFERVDIVKMIDDVVDFYRPLAELKGIALTAVASEQIATSGDALLLAQAVGNLIDNAVKYTQTRVTVEATVLRDAKRILICVSDDGIGISDVEKPRVTERFYRSHSSRGTDGVGLGLSLVAAVAKLHGGTFEMDDAHPGLHATLLIQQCNEFK
jgi:signal transduction histidine kinase